MTKKRIEVLVALLIIVGLIVLIWFVLQPSDKKDEGKVLEGEDIAEDGRPLISYPTPTGPAEILPHPIARIFVERFGSFSSESDYENIEDVLSLSTDGMQSTLNVILRDARASRSTGFYGISTHVLGLTVLSQDETTATIEVLTQREESIDSRANTSVRYQNIILNLVYLEGEWLVDNFIWSEG